MPKRKTKDPNGVSLPKRNGKNSTTQYQEASTVGTTYTTNRTPKTGHPSLGSQILACSNCELNCYKNKVVDPKLYKPLVKGLYLFVDDQPNLSDQIVQEPLVGPVGNNLRQLISLFFSPEKYLVMHQVICQSEKDKPTIKERENCYHNFQLILSTVQPKAIFALGTNVSKFLDKKKVQHIKLPNKYEIYLSELAKARATLVLKKYFEQGKV